MPEDRIARIIGDVCFETHYWFSLEEIRGVLAYVKKKADGIYETWSDPYFNLVEDELRNYVFRNRITELTCRSC